MLDYIEEDVILCYMCDERLIFGQQHRDIDEGIVCSQECDDKYLTLDEAAKQLIEIHRQEAI